MWFLLNTLCNASKWALGIITPNGCGEINTNNWTQQVNVDFNDFCDVIFWKLDDQCDIKDFDAKLE